MANEPVKTPARYAPGTYCVCSDLELQDQTSGGWELVRVMPRTHIEYSIDPQTFGRVPIQTPVRSHVYLIRRGTHADEIERLHARVADECKRAEESAKKQKEAEQSLSASAGEAKRRDEGWRLERERRREIEEKAAAMEVDLGRIRAAVGDLKMREILGEKKG